MKHLLFGGPGGATALADVGLLLARIGTGVFLAFGHGIKKLPPPDQFVAGVAAQGFPMPGVFAWAATLAEFAGGLLLVLGLLTRPAAFFILFTMGVAIFRAHAGASWFGGTGTREPAMLFAIPAVMFILTGAGRYSVDALIGGKRKKHGRGFPVD